MLEAKIVVEKGCDVAEKTMISSASFELIRQLVSDISKGNFKQIEQDGRAGRYFATDLEYAVKELQKTILEFPKEGFDSIKSYQQHDACGFDIPLWTKEDGLSDLILQVIIKNDEKIVIKDLRLMRK